MVHPDQNPHRTPRHARDLSDEPHQVRLDGTRRKHRTRPRTPSDEAPTGFSIVFAGPEPELSPTAATTLLRLLQRHARRAGSLGKGELSMDDRTTPNPADTRANAREERTTR